MEKDFFKQNNVSMASAYQENPGDQTSSLYPPTMTFGGGYPGAEPIPRSGQRHNYHEDYKRLKSDNIPPVEEAQLRTYGKLSYFSHDGYDVWKHKDSYQPWFIKKRSDPSNAMEPYTEGYRTEVLTSIREKPRQRKYIEFTGVKLKIAPEGSPISVDNGGSIGLESGDLSFDFNVTNGDFTIKTKLIPLGEVSGNIYKFPGFGLSPELKPQLGPFSFNPKNHSFEVELKIPGLPLSPSIVVGGKFNQPAIQQDLEHIMHYEWFPFIGELLDALRQ